MFRFEKGKKIEILDIILKATSENTEKTSSFFNHLETFIGSVMAIDLSKVGSS